MQITSKINMDLGLRGVAPTIYAVQGDTGRAMDIALFENGVPWNIPDGSSVYIAYKKSTGENVKCLTLSDGSPVAVFTGNIATVTFPPQMLDSDGIVTSTVIFVDEEAHQIASFPVLVNVEKNPGVDAEDEEEISPDHYTQILGAIALERTRVDSLISDMKANVIQQHPLFANSIEECTDTEKLYVLPDGYIYAYMYTESSGPAYTNLAGDVLENYRLNSSGVAKALDGAVTTGFIPVSQGDIVRVKGFDPTAVVSGNFPYICFYTAASESAILASEKWARGDSVWPGTWVSDGDAYKYECFYMANTQTQHTLASTITHIRINGAMIDGEEVIVTVNEEIVEGSAGGYAWQNTGHAFVPADYEDRIVALEEHAQAVSESRIAAVEEALENAQSAKPWTGKKWAAVGDSLTYDEYVTTDAYYHDHIAVSTGITVANMGQGGTGYKRTFDTGDGYAFYQRILNVPTDADVITIFGSGNDLSTTWETYGLGEATDSGTDTICGCINTTLDNLFSVYPAANVGIITPTPWKAFYPSAVEADGKAYRMTQLCEKLVEICRMRSIPCLDLYHCSGLRPWDKAFRDAFYTKDDVESDGELGGVHLDENGHKIIAAKIKAFLQSLL